MGHILSKLRSKKKTEEPMQKVHQEIAATTNNDTTYLEEQKNVNNETLQSKRDFHTEKISTYWLPKDDEEQDRLTGQHFAIKELYQGNILTSVKDALDFEKGISILDVGCGSGSWIMDMLLDYPNCQYTGCDIVAVTNSNVARFKFSLANILEGLGYPDNTFDFVHMRLFILALREVEWPIAIKEILRVTKPGGIIQLLEFDSKMTGGGNVAIEMAVLGSKVLLASPKQKNVNLSILVHSACKDRGQDPRIALQLERLVSESKNAKVIQADYRSIDMTSNTSAAKKFLWDWREGIKSMLPVLGPRIGLEDEAKQKVFLQELCDGLVSSESYTYMNAVAAQKI